MPGICLLDLVQHQCILFFFLIEDNRKSSFLYYLYLFTPLVLTVLGLCYSMRALSNCGAGLLILVVSLVAGKVFLLPSTGLVVVVHGFSCPEACGVFSGQTQVLCVGRRTPRH